MKILLQYILSIYIIFLSTDSYSQFTCEQADSSINYFPLTLPICIGSEKTYTAYSETGIPDITYKWMGRNGIILSNNSVVTFIASQPGADTIFLVTNYLACPTHIDTLAFYIKINPETILNLGPDQAFCDGLSTTLNASIIDATEYLWSTGATTPSITAFQNGEYSVTVSNICNYGSDSINIHLNPKPNINLGGNKEACFGTPVILDAVTTNAVYLWSTGATTQTISVNERNLSISVLVDSSGCQGGDTIYISDCPVEAQLPSAFSPNGDGNNDVFKVRGNNLSEVDLKIFNRLGILVYSGNTIDAGWDGSYKGIMQESDVYVFIMKAKLSDGKAFEKSGSVVLIK